MPLHIPTDETKTKVSALTSFGITQEEIAAYLDIDPKTLRKHYRRELGTGKTAATAKIAQRLFDVAMEGNVAALIFWLKTRARWRDDGGDTNEDAAQPIAVTVEVKDARKKADDAKS